MARNVCTFDSGNRAGLKLTPELHAQFVQIVQQTGRISIASGKCGLGVSTARHWMSRGRNEESGPYREFLDDVERARSDFLLFANRHLNRLATGGLVRLPAFTKDGTPVRNHKPECGVAPGYPCDCELVVVEKVLMPNPNVLMWQVDRLDPNPNGDPQQPDLPMAPELTQEERIAQAAQHYDLWRESIRIMLELGVPMPQLGLPAAAAIETTAAKVEAEQSSSAAMSVVAEPEPQPVAELVPEGPGPPAEPAKPKPPTVDEAF
jgi:hypothetical protein